MNWPKIVVKFTTIIQVVRLIIPMIKAVKSEMKQDKLKRE
jgi:hypothetical protein